MRNTGLSSLSHLGRFGIAFLLAIGIGPPSEAASLNANACAIAGDQCVKNSGDVAGCRAAQATCGAMQASSRLGPRGKTLTPDRKTGRFKLPEQPLAAPAEVETAGDTADQIALACDRQARNLIEDRLQGAIGRVVVTHHPRIGTVWRADASTPSSDGPYAQRLVCSQGIMMLSPLKMFDPSQDIAPLPAR